jgi:hypothetical protein
LRRAAALALLAVLAASCGVKRRSTDPLPSTAASAGPAAPSLVDASTVPVGGFEPSPEPASAKAAPAARSAPAKPARRVWGRVAISSAIVSPSQLIGPEVPFSPEFKRLAVFPEKLVFEVSWGLISVGQATLAVDRIVMFNGRPAYHLVSEAKSNSFCDTFYPVRDLNEAWLDARTLTSLGYSKKLREGHFFRDEWVLYDRDAGTFTARRTNRDGSFAVRAGTIPASVQDILSSIYYTRAQELPEGGSVVVDVNTPDNWPLGEGPRRQVPLGPGRARDAPRGPLRAEGQAPAPVALGRPAQGRPAHEGRGLLRPRHGGPARNAMIISR